MTTVLENKSHISEIELYTKLGNSLKIRKLPNEGIFDHPKGTICIMVGTQGYILNKNELKKLQVFLDEIIEKD